MHFIANADLALDHLMDYTIAKLPIIHINQPPLKKQHYIFTK
jgi:hypothetical protein